MLEQLQNIGDTISHTGELIVVKVFNASFKRANEAYDVNADGSIFNKHGSFNPEAQILSCSLLAWCDGELVLIEVQKSDVNSKVYSKLRELHPTTFKHYLDFDFIQDVDYDDDLAGYNQTLIDWALDASFQRLIRANRSEFQQYLIGQRVVFDTWDSALHTNKGSITLESYQRPGKKSISKIVCRDTHMRVMIDLPYDEIDQALQELESVGAICGNLGKDHEQLRNSEIKRNQLLLEMRQYDELKLSVAMERRCKRMAKQLEEEKQAKQQAEAEGRVYEEPQFNFKALVQQLRMEQDEDIRRQKQRAEAEGRVYEEPKSNLSARYQQHINELIANSLRQRQHTQHSSGDEAIQNAPELPQNDTQD